MKIQCMRIACQTPKAKNTHSDYAILIAFPLQHWLHKHASMLRYTYIASLVNTWFHIHMNENLHYLSYIIRNPLFLVSFTKMNSPLATLPTAKLSPIKFAIFFTHFYIIILEPSLHMESLQTLLQSCLQQSTSFLQFHSQVFSLNISLYNVWLSVSSFTLLWCVY